MRNTFWLLLLSQFAFAQFAPPAGQVGTTALYKDSSAFIGWVNFCSIQRGLQDISNTSGPYATVGDSSSAFGKADNSVVSLGDGGIAICQIAPPLSDGPGNDFAIFENSFSDDYLEFGFVEVSSDGVNFFRFPATCNIQDTVQTGSFGLSDATKVNNLAGKYRGTYGTPFDLNELAGLSSLLDVHYITYVKIIDVVGSIDSLYATYDMNNHKVNDPWVTPFPSSGFDLDAVGIIHNVFDEVKENKGQENISVYPNPCPVGERVEVQGLKEVEGTKFEVQVLDVCGKFVRTSHLTPRTFQIDVSFLKSGIYFLQIKTKDKAITKKLIITE